MTETEERVVFTLEMKQTHTILVPMMLPIHFGLMKIILEKEGFRLAIIDTRDPEIIDTGLKYVHNDMCYPAQLTIGQLIHAVESGMYPRDKIALMLMQTGGGCRASNYIRLLRKGLKKAGYGDIPVISMNYTGLEKDPGFDLDIKAIVKLVKSIIYSDLLMCLRNQILPYEVQAGATDALVDKWNYQLGEQFAQDKGLSKKQIKQNLEQICKEFAQIEVKKTDKVRVGIVGEIYVKFAPLGNNNLEAFLRSEDAEPVVPGLLDFVLYTLDTHEEDQKIYGGSKKKAFIYKWLVNYFCNLQELSVQAVEKYPQFTSPSSFRSTKKAVKDVLHYGVKMGEGWLLTAEMLELIESGVNNIVCTQPFGCLPNHVCGRGMMRKIKELHPDANIVAIDYDASATKVNQENRLKLMLSTARGISKEI